MAGSRHSEADITAGLLSLIAWAGNASAAARALKAEGKLDVSSSTLISWSRERYAERYNELADKYKETLEAQIVQRLREGTSNALDVQQLALEKARERLEKGEDQDPGRTAANAARVAQSNTDKMLSLSGRPTSIREDRNTEEILRGLVARGVLLLPEGDATEEPEPQEGEKP